jgi:hypothetical protein
VNIGHKTLIHAAYDRKNSTGKAHAPNARFLEQASLKGNIIRTIFSPLLGPPGAVVTGCCPVDDKAGPALGGHYVLPLFK